MLKITRNTEDTGIIRVNLYGRFSGEYAPEVARALVVNASAIKQLALDLTNVTFVDRVAMEFIRTVELREVRVENLPSYVARWIKQENTNESKHQKSLEYQSTQQLKLTVKPEENTRAT